MIVSRTRAHAELRMLVAVLGDAEAESFEWLVSLLGPAGFEAFRSAGGVGSGILQGRSLTR